MICRGRSPVVTVLSWSNVRIVLSLSVGFAGYRAFRAYRQARKFPGRWRALAEQPVPERGLRLVALGDSTMQAIGASVVWDGVAGRTVRYLEAVTGRPVHVANHAVGGATVADILRDQVPQADLAGADVVIVSSGNDMEKRKPLDAYRADLSSDPADSGRLTGVDRTAGPVASRVRRRR